MPTITASLERPGLLAGAALAALDMGQMENARSYVVQAYDYAYDHGLVYLQPLVVYTQGCVAEAQGEADNALASLPGPRLWARAWVCSP